MKTPLMLLVPLVCLTALSVASQESVDSLKFLADYTSPEQQEVPADGIYPLGQRMPISAYSTSSSQQLRLRDAGFSMDGPHYHGLGKWMLPNWETAEAAGMKNYFRLRIHDYKGRSHWGAVLPQMKTEEGRAGIKKQITDMINYVQSDPELDSNIVAWYGYPEEPMPRDSTPLAEERAYMKLVHDVIVSTDQKRRPLYVSERGDSGQYIMIGNSPYQDGSLKQNYLIESNAFGGDDEMRVLQWQWARDQVITAEKADEESPSYTGRKRAAISTLAMFRDPKDESKRNEAWLRKIITYDIYAQLAAGIDGFALYTCSRDSSYAQKTKSIQEDIYIETLGMISQSGLGKVFLWGDDRDDIEMEIVQGPKTVEWKKYRDWFTAPSIFMRNIQYDDNRYILLVNNSKEVIRPRLSGFPSGLRILDMIPNEWDDLEATLTPTIQPLGVHMYKIAGE